MLSLSLSPDDKPTTLPLEEDASRDFAFRVTQSSIRNSRFADESMYGRSHAPYIAVSIRNGPVLARPDFLKQAAYCIRSSRHMGKAPYPYYIVLPSAPHYSAARQKKPQCLNMYIAFPFYAEASILLVVERFAVGFPGPRVSSVSYYQTIRMQCIQRTSSLDWKYVRTPSRSPSLKV